MERRTYLNLSLFFCLVSSGLAQDQPLQLPNPATFRTDRILAKPKPGFEVSSFSEINASGGDRLIRRFESLGDLQVIQLRPGRKVSEAVAQYQRSGLFEYVQPDFIYELAVEPNDPKFGEGMWGLNDRHLDRDIDAPEAWDIRHSAPNVIVAVIDTGIRHTHEDLAGNMWVNSEEIPGNDIDDDQNGYVDDVHGIDAVKDNGDSKDGHGHGTHVAGTIGAVGNNGIGVVGVAWKVQLMACNLFSSDRKGSDSDAIQCIEYARKHGAQVINASWGSFGYSPALREAIAAAGREGILFVAAAGNNTYSLDLAAFYPASFDLDNVVSVTASDGTDRLAIFSNRGQGRIHLAAPGDGILSTWFESDSSYKYLSGTSMAAPHVSGAMALMWAQFPQKDHAQLINRLLASVDGIDFMKGTSATGGRLNLASALRSSSTRPANDAFDRRYPVSNRDLSVQPHHILLTGSNVDATKEPGEPGGPATASGKTVWWSWTAPATGLMTLSTRGSNFDTFLAIYTGSSLQDLVEVASNDNEPDGGNSSWVSFQAQEGVTYSIAVDGSQGESGRIVLAAPPHNDINGSISRST